MKSCFRHLEEMADPLRHIIQFSIAAVRPTQETMILSMSSKERAKAEQSEYEIELIVVYC